MKNSPVSLTKTEKRVKLVPPDGGWGWIIVLGTGLSTIFNQSMLSLFSLLYGDALEAMGHRTAGAAIVMNTMLCVSNCSGPFAGVLVKLTSPRFVCVTGSIICTVGIFLSGFSTNIIHLVITYGILLGAGLGFIQNASFVAINSYFKLKKSIAVGIAMTGTGIGQTLMPHVVRYLLDSYGFRGACLLLSAMSLHGICGTLLIQPVEWHMKKIEEEVVVDEKVNLLEESKKNDELNNTAQRATSPIVNDDGKQKLVPDFHSHRDLKSLGDSKSNGHLNGTSKSPQNTKSGLRKLYELFDISLLKNPRFLNVIIGTALTSISLQNFSMLYPLFLQNAAGMNKQETANCMSAVAFADIIGRLSIPQLQAKFNISARMTLIITCIWVFIVRQILAYQTDIYVILVLSSMYGIGRSMVIVARNITISEQCQVEQVASAVGLGMLSMGLLTPPIGYFLGWVRDFTEDYIACISAQNAILILFLIMWIPDMLHQYYQKKKEKVDETEMT
ncbi:monocarboxylate transporter 12-B-like isoform X2 [Pieris napi]|uniref:monocarboxylate transporter 12-B-like isoform X2 n=1 Tax=Pieris napi TaxID=78633 RepID=UPI001FBA9037|nr:monocarboxylate transporter 12-B-like isoform X2 [Pieris napi]XP_047505571.1 monocarboxylate transporter 12-B-like isoform X2 [Pieris napi]